MYNVIRLKKEYVLLMLIIFSLIYAHSIHAQNKEKEVQPEMSKKVFDKASPVTVKIICDNGLKISSGVIIGIVGTTKGNRAIVLTACHVISSNYEDKDSGVALEFPEDIQLKLLGDLAPVSSRIVPTFIDKDNDIALILTKDYVSEDRVINYIFSNQVKPGQKVAALGLPKTDKLSQTVGRIVSEEGKYFIFDANIEPGSSGGPLVDKHGRLIGISSYIAGNKGYALKTDIVVPIVNNWLKNAKLKKVWNHQPYGSSWEKLYRNPYYLIAEGGIVGGVIYMITNKGNGTPETIFGKPPEPPNK